MRVAFTGSSGLIGSALAEDLQRDGNEVVRLVRRSPREPGEIAWNPRDPGGGLDPAALDGLDKTHGTDRALERIWWRG